MKANDLSQFVALHGAWIETRYPMAIVHTIRRPYTGAWIETIITIAMCAKIA